MVIKLLTIVSLFMLGACAVYPTGSVEVGAPVVVAPAPVYYTSRPYYAPTPRYYAAPQRYYAPRYQHYYHR